MRARRAVVAVGVGATVFLATLVVGVEVVGSDVPSLLSVLPIAVVVALVVATGTFLAAGRALASPVLGGLAGVAAFGYAVFLQLAVRYAVPATRRALQIDAMVLLATLAAILVAGAVRYDDAR
ncbi:hypothetical protein BRC85_02000 [Halobacteriales archaeon QS_1_69_70]|nr:MAG: hypothetical protein BRC85_02000 [Halobacteriales archaeon QS_1_69_70]